MISENCVLHNGYRVANVISDLLIVHTNRIDIQNVIL